jgi:NhaP-type Na+/H+ or K+/H+ antiporter
VFDSRDQPFPALIIRAPGKQFVIPNGKPYEGDDDTFHDAWMAAVTLWNAAIELDREQIWEHSDILVRAHSLYEVLVRRGFVPRGPAGGLQPC